MMESSLAGKPERVGPVEVGDIRRDLLRDFTALPSQQESQPQSENLQVFLRIRPFTSAESSSGEDQDCVSMEDPQTVILKAPRSVQSKSLPQTGQKFTFTQVFGAEASQRRVFEGSVRGVVRDVMDGANCLVFTYGVTNAGKTFTFLGPDHDLGLLPRSLAVIFNSVDGRLYSRSDLKPLRCRDFSRLTPDQQNQDSTAKRNLLRTLKETDKSHTSGRSTFLNGSGVTDSSLNSTLDSDSFVLDVGDSVKFSVWVSFCEIYNDNIHDLLEHVPNGHQKRTVLRLCQDVKGNSFIKDLRWVQVNSSEEAYRIMKIGKKNQSFSATRLNQVSSRSHSIFSVRIMRIDDVGVGRVLGISELSLCDLAGSERCSRTQNTGDRLKEAGNINNSLLTLGKCISAMRVNQHNRLQQHVPFRESKLTHFLQWFFVGSTSGRVVMVVNINQNLSSIDETLNVLKFSALAQKVVVLNQRPPPSPPSHPSALDLSMVIDEADSRRYRSRRSSLIGWERSLEDVLEAEGEALGEETMEEELEEEESEEEAEGTVLEAGDHTTMEERQSDREAALRLVLEAQIREEVSAEFMELFNKMEQDYSERLEKEREILEERAEKRVEILKNLVSRTMDLTEPRSVVESIRSELMQIQQNCSCLRGRREETRERGEETRSEGGKDERKRQRDSMEEESAPAKKRVLLEEEIWRLQEENDLKEQLLRDLRLQQREEAQQREERLEEQRARMEEEMKELQEEVTRLQEEVQHREQRMEEQRARMEEEIKELQEEVSRLQGEVQQREEQLQEEVQQREERLKQELRESEVLMSLESEQRETSRLNKENKALVNGIFTLQTQVTDLQKQLRSQSDRSDSLSEELNFTKSRLHSLQSQSDERDQTLDDLRGEVERLKHEAKEEEVFHEAVDRLKEESEAALKKSSEKNQQIQELQESLRQSERCCAELREEASNQSAAFERLEAELKEQCQSLKSRLEETKRGTEEARKHARDLEETLVLREQTVTEAHHQTKVLQRELERLREQLESEDQEETHQKDKENLQQACEEEHCEEVHEEEHEEDKENPQEHREEVRGEEQAVTVVEELKQELNKLHQRQRNRGGAEEEHRPETKEEQRMEAVRREVQRFRELQNHNIQRAGGGSPQVCERRRTPRTTGRKRKSCELQGLVFSENKRNRGRVLLKQTSSTSVKDRPTTKLRDLLYKSPSIIASTAKVLMENRTIRKRRKLYGTSSTSPLQDSPDTVLGGSLEDRESSHSALRRQLRSQTCRK